MDSDDDDFFVLNRPKEEKKDNRVIKSEKKIKKAKKKKKKQTTPKTIPEHVKNEIIRPPNSPDDGIYETTRNDFSSSGINGVQHRPSEAISDIMKEIRDVEQEAVASQYRSNTNQINTIFENPQMHDERVIEEDDDFEIRQVQQKFKMVQSQIQLSLGPSMSPEEIEKVRLQQETERKRVYQFKIFSKLPGSENYETLVEVNGSMKLQKVMRATLKHIASVAYISPEYREQYRVDNVVLIWKSNIKLFDYMRPSFLNLPEPPYNGGKTFVTVHIMTKEDAEKLNEDMNLNIEDRPDEEEVQEVSDYEVDLEDDNDTPGPKLVEDDDDDEGYFTIVLKDKDNVKFEIKVKSDTALRKVADYYLKKKGFPASTKIQLIFDDEPLNLKENVGDTELEDEFGVDVVTS